MASFRGAVILLSLLVAGSAANYLGCFNITEEIHRHRHGNHHNHRNTSEILTNADCVRQCAHYPLALTRGDACTCHTSAVLTGALSLDDVWCRRPCSGSACRESGDSCVGDECCGGDATNVYSVYTAGGPDWVDEIKRRTTRAVKEKLDKLPEFAQFIADGASRFTAVRGPRGNGSRHDANPFHYTTDVVKREDCEKECLEREACHSFTITSVNPGLVACFLFNISSRESNIQHSDNSLVYDKVHSPGSPRIVNNVFHMKLNNFTVMSNRVTAQSTHPLDNKVYALDLLKSNERNDITRKISVKHLDHYDVHTLSGMTSNTSLNENRGTSRALCSSEHNATIQLLPSDSPSQILSHHSLEPLSLRFREELSAALNGEPNHSQNREYRLQNGDASGSTTLLHRDFKAKFLNSTTETYSASMKVPPFHRGELSFLLTEQHREFLWKASLQLSDYIKVCFGDDVKDIHVSRLLSNKKRTFEVLGQVFYTEHTITSKIEIWDSAGVLVSPTK